ncbi:DUF1636 domain-containing protein [Mesobaculum littorinae]|uniref:DUF1636 domain-containing protein n=1 Tax=Mesobaculum littorinae TaxID=2486419 RepID=A0A438AFB5_9RHOB|nr:DUF1636 domain-containing protein [Mesobaculum littorinae]RVV97410.1 DUF1636 domain-containing protein [Mesobaculum littorinae]
MSVGPTWITVCDTCKEGGVPGPEGAQPRGTHLFELIEERLSPEDPDLRLRRTSCLMGCASGCNVAIQAAGKLCYTLGRFDAGPETAQGILDWARLHAASPSGQVPYRTWPAAVKGHFVTRHPPLPET